MFTFHIFIKCVSLLFTISLFYIVCRTYGLLGRVPYVTHSVIFTIEEGISYDTFSFILMSICLLWLAWEASLPAVMMNRWLQQSPLNKVVAKSNPKHFIPHYDCDDGILICISSRHSKV